MCRKITLDFSDNGTLRKIEIIENDTRRVDHNLFNYSGGTISNGSRYHDVNREPEMDSYTKAFLRFARRNS